MLGLLIACNSNPVILRGRHVGTHTWRWAMFRFIGFQFAIQLLLYYFCQVIYSCNSIHSNTIWYTCIYHGYFSSGILALILIRTLRRDIARYNMKDEELVSVHVHVPCLSYYVIAALGWSSWRNRMEVGSWGCISTSEPSYSPGCICWVWSTAHLYVPHHTR